MSNISFSSGYGEYVSGEFLGGLGFELKSNDEFIFLREFRSNSELVVDLELDLFKFRDHNFVTGEELVYEYQFSPSNRPIRISPTVISGVTTDILPRTIYAIKADTSSIQVAATKEDALKTVPLNLNLTNYGVGIHRISSKNPNLNALITINNVIQDPVISTGITSNTLESISEKDLSVRVRNPESFTGGDLFKIDNEFFSVLSVGVGTTNNLFFDRGLLGTLERPHNTNSVITKINGNYNIEGSFIYFTAPPYGNFFDLESGLTNGSTFAGRVFLRSGVPNTDIGPYDKNFILDDISNDFNGRTKSFNLKENFNNVDGFFEDNAILTINDVFQSPSRLNGNVINGSYVLGEVSGITSITFTGNDNVPKYDINLSELPRGGVIFSVGSNESFGYQPLISAGGTALISVAGTVQSISIGNTGSGYRSGIQTVNVGVGYSNINNFDYTLIGRATISSGGITTVVITNPGFGYTSTNPPEVYFDAPLSYSNLPLIYTGNSTGIGTEATIDIKVGQGSSIIDFNLNKLGYAFKENDILTIRSGNTGIPTTSSPNFKEFQLKVEKVFNDQSSIRTIGQLVLFDPIDNLFDGRRKSFPLKINGEQTSIFSKIGSDLKVENSLLIFIDTILQVPGESYNFNGGSILTFKEAPGIDSKSTIIFYGGTSGVDTENREVIQTLKIGDNLTIFDKIDRFNDQNARTIYDIISADAVKTNLYNKQGISDQDEIRPVKWCPQNVDKFIAGSGTTDSSVVTKDRVIYEPSIYPTAFVIAGLGSTANQIFVDNVKTFFDNKNESPLVNNISIISQRVQKQCYLNATVSVAGTISSIDIIDPGLGYFSTPQVSISNPVSIGITALATCGIDSIGRVSSVNIVNAGFGYSTETPVFVIVESPQKQVEFAEEVSYQGDFGIICGVGTTAGFLRLDLHIPRNSFLRDPSINQVGAAISGSSGLTTGYYFYVNNSNVGSNITSLDVNNNVIGISTQFIDNVYQVVSNTVRQKVVLGVGLTTVSEVLVKVSGTPSITGLGASGFYGEYSWGRIFNVNKTGFNQFPAFAPGITTSTIIQRSNPLKFINYTD